MRKEKKRVCPVWVFSLGSCLQMKTESITQCVLYRLCGLKDGMGLDRGFPRKFKCKTYLKLQ